MRLALGAPAAAEGSGSFSDFPLVVEVYPVRSEQEVKRLYLEVNKSESVKEIDLPDAIAPVSRQLVE